MNKESELISLEYRLRKLYKEGKTDLAIAELSGTTLDFVITWRRYSKLKENINIYSTYNYQNRQNDKLDHVKAAELYMQGLSDADIADQMGYHPNTVSKWRNDNDLPRNKLTYSNNNSGNKTDGPRTVDEDSHNERMELYMQGLSDGEIAEITGLTPGGVYAWRRRNKLETNLEYKGPTHVHYNRLDLYKAGYTDQEIADMDGVTKGTVTKWRRVNKLPLLTKQSDIRMKLYEEGLTDKQIAGKQDVRPESVAKWRRGRDLKPNKKK